MMIHEEDTGMSNSFEIRRRELRANTANTGTPYVMRSNRLKTPFATERYNFPAHLVFRKCGRPA
jgi:hypothetical protein